MATYQIWARGKIHLCRGGGGGGGDQYVGWVGAATKDSGITWLLLLGGATDVSVRILVSICLGEGAVSGM